MRKYFVRFIAPTALTIAALSFFSGANPGFAFTKVIGDWEGDGNMASPYTIDYELTGGSCDQAAGPVNWCTTAGNGGPMTFDWINVNDGDYVGGVTRGDWALKITYPPQWDEGPYLRLHGQEQLMDDSADYPYLLIDVTTFGPAVDPSGAPEGQGPYRQMFSVFNIPNLADPNSSIFYDANFDTDMQHEIEIADFEEDFFTHTVVVDMTATAPVNDDDKNVMNVTADFYRTQHNDGTPIENFLWQLVWPFQGRNYPGESQISVVIDNVRFCDDSLEVCLAPPVDPGVLGDFNDDGTVNAADYVTFRKAEGTMTALPNDGGLGGTVGPAHDNLWRANFGNAALGAGAVGAVPEPASVVLMLSCVMVLPLRRRARS
jgi:hypothetical protein